MTGIIDQLEPLYTEMCELMGELCGNERYLGVLESYFPTSLSDRVQATSWLDLCGQGRCHGLGRCKFEGRANCVIALLRAERHPDMGGTYRSNIDQG